MEIETEYLVYYARDAERLFFNQLWEDRKPQWMAVMTKYNRGGPTGGPIVYQGKKYYPPEGYSWAVGGEVAKNLLQEGRMRIRNGKPEILIDKRTVGSNWTDIPGYSSPSRWGFSTENHEKLLKRSIQTASSEKDIVLDFFLGIGTTCAVAHKLRRKWIGIELGDHFYSFQDGRGESSGVVVRMKEILAGKGNHEPCGISKEVNWQGGGFFKYYELEQYEEALANCKYKDGDLFSIPSRSPYQEYVFMKDEKMLKVLEIDYKKEKVKVDLSKLYPNIDIAETLSNLTGKWIKKVNDTEVEFKDGTKINTKDLDYKLIKPLIWW